MRAIQTLAIAAAAGVTEAIVLAGGVWLTGVYRPGQLGGGLPVWANLLILAVLAIVMVSILILPPFFWLARRGRLNLRSALIVGCVQAAIMVAISLMTMKVMMPSRLAINVVRLSLVGFTGALAAWGAWRATGGRPPRATDAAEMF